MKTKDIIRTAAIRAGCETWKALSVKANLSEASIAKWKCNNYFPLWSIRQIDAVVHFTDAECAKLIRG